MTAAIISRRARAELAEAIAWIARDNPTAARALNSAVARLATLIGAHPAMGSVRTALAPAHYRFLPVKGFSYIIIYRGNGGRPRILRIVHSSRDLHGALRDLL
jgi:plasmid stabilization system protein ParE